MKKFQMRDDGFFRIQIEDQFSNWTSYDSIAYLTVDGKTYAGVSDYYHGSLPHETIFEITLVEGVSSELIPIFEKF